MIGPRRTFHLPLPHGPGLTLGPRTLVMGVLNLTPDSFSDGGATLDHGAAVARALDLVDQGADLLDIGGESTRPGAEPVGAEEEWRRLQPVLREVIPQARVPVSIDTYRASTAERALDLGALIVNDISALAYDPPLADVIARTGAALVLMHTRGRPRDMYREAHYGDVVTEVRDEMEAAVARAVEQGVAFERIIVDPGYGFAKQAAHSMTLLARFSELATLDRPLLSGPSRKSFLTSATGPLAPAERDWATAAAVTASVLGGAHVVRVHRVRELVQAVRVADAIRDVTMPLR